MTLFMKIQEEREKAEIERTITLYRDLGQSEESLLDRIAKDFHLTKEEALRRITEYDFQYA